MSVNIYLGIFLILFCTIAPTIILMVILKAIINKNTKVNSKQLDKIDKTFYYRDIPCNKDLNLVYYLLNNFSNIPKEVINSGLFNAYILSWYKNGYISVIDKGNNNYVIDLKDGNWQKNMVEERLYNFFKSVAGNNNLLEKNELKRFCSVYNNIKSLFFEIDDDIKYDLNTKKLITIKRVSLSKPDEIILSDSLKTEYQNLMGLKNFLENLSNMNEKMHIEVHLWDEYLIFSCLFGIADTVRSQMKQLNANYSSIVFNGYYSCDVGIVGMAKAAYNYSKFSVGRMLFVALIIILVIVFGSKFTDSFAPVFVIIIFASVLIFLFRNYINNKKVKEFDGKTNAIVTNVKFKKAAYESDTDKYYFDYKFTINGFEYEGKGHDTRSKKTGDYVKIRYNLKNPNSSQYAKNYNEPLVILLLVVFSIIVVVYFLYIASK